MGEYCKALRVEEEKKDIKNRECVPGREVALNKREGYLLAEAVASYCVGFFSRSYVAI